MPVSAKPIKDADKVFMNDVTKFPYGDLRSYMVEVLQHVTRLEYVLKLIISDLPKNRDWLSTNLEEWAKELLDKKIGGE